jgi:hypothetical protein
MSVASHKGGRRTCGFHINNCVTRHNGKLIIVWHHFLKFYSLLPLSPAIFNAEIRLA